MYELVCLRKAFDGKSVNEIIHLIVEENPPEIESTHLLRSISIEYMKLERLQRSFLYLKLKSKENFL
jgi:hypothetical protein